MSRYPHKSIDVPADKDVVLDIVFPPGARVSGRVTQGAKPAADRSIWVGRQAATRRSGIEGGLRKMAAMRSKECRPASTASASDKMRAASSQSQATLL